MGGSNNRHLETFRVYCPKAFAGIGDCLPDTILDRSIPIRLKRRTRNEPVERFRLRDVEPQGHELRDRLADWLEPQRDHIGASRPALPDELDDRAQDCWEHPLAIADLAGGDWSDRARCAALALSTGEEREDDSITATLLRDIRGIFATNAHDAYKTADLLSLLHANEESPWGDWYGKPLSAHGLSRLLKPYRIKTMTVYVGHGESVRGYKVAQFRDAFSRLLDHPSDRSDRSESPSHAASNASNASNAYPVKGPDEADPDADTDFDASRPFPILGDPGYIGALEAAFTNGHITAQEWNEAYQLHKAIVSAKGQVAS
jgi:Protein of unknown function (DUF3631)